MRPPQSRMDILTTAEIDAIVAKSKIAAKYNQVIDNESAYEILTKKLEDAAANNQQNNNSGGSGKPQPSTLDKILSNPAVRQVERTAASIITRSLLGSLGLGGRSRR
jgi:hypothetical protein